MPGVTTYDTFSRPDSATALGNTETGLAWSVSAGTTWGVSGGKAYCPTLGSTSIWPGPGGHAFTDIGSADMVVEAVITGMGSVVNGAYGILARYQDAQNFWTAFVINSSGSPLFYCGQVVAGAATYSVASAVALSGSGPWLLRLVARGNIISLYVDGVLRGSVANSSFNTQTQAGILAGNAGAIPALIDTWGARPAPAIWGPSSHVLLEDDFTSLPGGWTSGGSWSVVNGTWATAPGDPSGNTHLYRAMPTGCTFAEVLWFGGATSGDNWGAIKLRNNNGASFNADGLGVLYRSDTNAGAAAYGMQMFNVGSPAVTFFGVNAAVAFDYPPPALHNNGPTWPTSLGSALRIGIWSPNTTDVYVYVNRILVAKAIGNTAQSGTGVQISSYNSNNSNYDYCVLADAPLDYYTYGLHPGDMPGVSV